MALDLSFSPVGESELDEVRRFLQSVFSTPDNWKPFTREVMLWKCFALHPLWPGTRSYALRFRGEIVAHGSLVPGEFVAEIGAVSTACVIDWAASKKLPGAGALLYQNIQKLTGTLLAIGGSDNARTVLPRLGFQAKAQFGVYVRVVRPWKLYRDTEPRTWKDAARLARNVLLARRAPAPAGWTARKVAGFDDSIPLPSPAIWHDVVCRRTPELLNYFLACPGAAVSGFVIEHAGQSAGYFIVSRVAAECRIAEVWVNSAGQLDWNSAYALATKLAARDPSVTRILAAASSPHARTAIEAAGLRHIDTQDFSIRDPKETLAGQSKFSVSLLENDAFYL